MSSQEEIRILKSRVFEMRRKGVREDIISKEVQKSVATIKRYISTQKEEIALAITNDDSNAVLANFYEESRLRIQHYWNIISKKHRGKTFSEKTGDRISALNSLREESKESWKRAQDIGIVPSTPGIVNMPGSNPIQVNNPELNFSVVKVIEAVEAEKEKRAKGGGGLNDS